MGKTGQIVNGYVDVVLPYFPAPKPYSSGQTWVLTDAEYAALPASVTRALTNVTTVADPNRTPTDKFAHVETVNATATGALSLQPGANFLTLTGAITSVTALGALPGTESNYSLYLKQDPTGSRLVTWGSAFKFAAGTAPTLSTAAGKTDILRFATVDGGVTLFNTDIILDLR